MAHFFSCFQRAYFIYLRTFGRQENAALAALRKVLAGRTLTDMEQQELTLGPQEAWLLFELREHKNEQAFPVDYMYATLSAAFPQKVYAVIFHEKIVGLLRTSRTDPYAQQALGDFSEAVFRMGYCVGLSNPFTLLHQAQDYLAQVSYTLAQTLDAGQKLSFFRDHVLSCMLDACLNELPVVLQTLRELPAAGATLGFFPVRVHCHRPNLPLRKVAERTHTNVPAYRLLFYPLRQVP